MLSNQAEIVANFVGIYVINWRVFLVQQNYTWSH